MEWKNLRPCVYEYFRVGTYKYLIIINNNNYNLLLNHTRERCEI